MYHLFLKTSLSLLLFLPMLAQAQATPEKSPEELKTLLQKSKQDKNRVNLLLDLGKYYLYKPGEEQSDLDSAMLLARQAEQLSKSLNYSSGSNESSFLIGNVYVEQGNLHSAIVLLDITKDTSRIKLLNRIGAYYVFSSTEEKNTLDSASIFLQQAQQENKVIQHLTQQRDNLYFLGSYFLAKGDVPAAKKCFTEFMNFYSEEKDKLEEAEKWWSVAGLMEYYPNSQEESMAYYEKAILLYDQLNKKQELSEIFYNILVKYQSPTNLDKSEKELLELKERLDAAGFRHLHYLYNVLMETNTLKGNLNRALLYSMETIKSINATGDSSMVYVLYYRIGRIYWHLGNIENSLEWWKKAYHTTPSLDFIYDRGALVVDCLLKLGRAEEALAFIKTVEKRGKPVGLYEKCSYLESMGDCYHALGQPEKAEKYYLEMMQKEAELGEYHPFTVPYNYAIGSFYVDVHHYTKAEPYLKKILSTPPGWITAGKLRDTHLLLFKVDSATGNYVEAIRHFQLHKTINDSLFNVTKSQQIEELQIQYETEQKEKNIQLLQNESQLQQSQLAQANLTKNITFGGITLLIIIVGLLYNRYRLKQRSNRQLEIQQIEINQTNQSLQNLLEEKEWLLREIHHRVKNNLQIVMSLLNTQSAYLESGVALTAIRDSQHRIHSISLIHQKLYQSDNVALIDMEIYIHELVEYLQDSFDIENHIHFEVNIEPIELDVTQAVPLGLILNEAISNAIKYAFPTGSKGEISITLQQIEEDQFQLNIADNGIGLIADFDINKCNSLGMSLMKGLSKQIGGTFELKNDNGLVINIEFVKEQIIKSSIKSRELELTA